MKKIINSVRAVMLLIILVFTACNKIDHTGDPFTLANTAPIAHAGKDTTIIFPVTSVLLDGSASTDKENNIVSYSWRYLTDTMYGITLEKVDFAKTTVPFMKNGIYEFELTVTDKGGLTSKDTIQVSAILEQPKPGNIKAGDDITVSLPFNKTVLETIFKVPDPNAESIVYNWKKISGPNSFNIQNQNSGWAIVSDLIEGVYQFEITVTHWNQLTEKDTTIITVLPDNNVYTTEKLFENIHPGCDDSSCSISINNISSIIPAGQPFKVYMKLDLNTNWQILMPAGQDFYHLYYEYLIKDNSMEIVTYGFDGWEEEGTANNIENQNTSVKIVY